MKKTIALLLVTIMMLGVLAGCNVKTKDQVTGGDTEGPAVNAQPVDITLLAMSAYEKDVNIVRDQLSKAGFNVKLNLQPDYGSFVGQKDAGNYDLAISGWTTVTGNPDYAVRSLFTTGGDYNDYGLSNSDLDRLVEEAATQTPDQYVNTYKEFEKILVEDNAYIVPLYSSYKSQAINKEILKLDSVRLSKSRSLPWEELDFVDESKRTSEPFLFSQTMPSLTSLDPIKGNDGSINIINTNQYIRLVNLTDDDEVTSKGSLSYNNVIGEGNQEYYFVLRDDVRFAKVENKKAVDSGELVAAEDVVFSMNRAKDKNSVPDHRTYSLHSSMDKIEIVTDIAELESKNESGKNTNVKEALEKGLPSPINQLVADKKDVNNAAGSYQVVKITTNKPFPQVLNYLAHQSAGIVSKSQVEAINTYDVATYDRNKDIAYGDQTTITEGSTYNNTLATSGPYIAIYKNDYEVVFEKNPGYMKGTEHEPRISKVVVKFIKDADSSLSAFRSGEVHLLYSVPEDKYSLVESDSKLFLQKRPSNAVNYAFFNLKGNSKFSDVNLRKAVLSSVNQDEFLAVYNNLKLKAYSTVSPLVDTGNVHTADPAKAKEYLNLYWESQK
ncbi:peptide/nickel transport system substrate-binding protein [Proteiniborus ethanoligenes]|uniref:Peptide/nickel transport system substrate-binding protein n=1 Tax=Proteiniborus ethanoligenes TaxID=415015 RepID=A0A1H3PUM1_9FIRM|nr:ABC transporter substrate-binding protein [Proteiniborus ethanoligenes]SDZ04099.1 peptide/nickel transport system substrate-binding protein [Proteiniborus ethanoligenes]